MNKGLTCVPWIWLYGVADVKGQQRKTYLSALPTLLQHEYNNGIEDQRFKDWHYGLGDEIGYHKVAKKMGFCLGEFVHPLGLGGSTYRWDTHLLLLALAVEPYELWVATAVDVAVEVELSLG